MIAKTRPRRRWFSWGSVAVVAMLALLGGLIYAAAGGVSLDAGNGPKPLATSPIAPAGVRPPSDAMSLPLAVHPSRKVIVAGEPTTEYLVQTTSRVAIATNGLPADTAEYRVTLFPNATYWAACTVTVNRLPFYGLPNTTPSSVATLWYVPVYSFTIDLAGMPDCVSNGK